MRVPKRERCDACGARTEWGSDRQLSDRLRRLLPKWVPRGRDVVTNMLGLPPFPLRYELDDGDNARPKTSRSLTHFLCAPGFPTGSSFHARYALGRDVLNELLR
jgi:hypothetical protein